MEDSDQQGHFPTLSEVLGRVHKLENKFAVHEQKCESSRNKLVDIIDRLNVMSRKIEVLHEDEVARRSVWWTLSMMAVIGVTVLNLAIAILQMLD